MPAKQQHNYVHWVRLAPADAMVRAYEYLLEGGVRRLAKRMRVTVPPFAFAGEIARMLRLPPTIVKQIAALQQKRHAAVLAPGSITVYDASGFIRQVERLASRF